MHAFLSCDWGTTSFRLRLAACDTGIVLAEETGGIGIAAMYQAWLQQKEPDAKRRAFYQSYLHGQIKKLEATSQCDLKNLHLLISGMASSSIGMMELPYKPFPFRVGGADLTRHHTPASSLFPYECIVVSGAATAMDVMRGEETLLVGCADATEASCVFIFPGTHSKHVWVKHGIAYDLRTYMTGEAFALFAAHSILANSIAAADESDTIDKQFFEKGVLEGAACNLLNGLFHVRTAALFNHHTPAQNRSYLSGLFIGAELRDLMHEDIPAICLVSSAGLKPLYTQALQLLALKNVRHHDADAALVNGHNIILQAMRY